jgi:HEAT repeat protein
LLKPAKIAGQPIPALLDLLKSPEDNVRERAKIELGARDTAKVLPALKTWVSKLDPKDAEFEHHRTEALWVHQWHNVVDTDLLARVLASPDHRARTAATRVLGYWRDRVPNPLAQLKTLAADPHPRVRLEAIRVASFFKDVAAVDVALAPLQQKTDYYIDYTMKETLRQLEPVWRKAVAEGRPVAAGNPAGVDYLMRTASTAELLKFPRTPGVLSTILRRPDVLDTDRTAALAELAAANKTTRVATLLDTIEAVSNADAASLTALGRILPAESPAEVKALRAAGKPTVPSTLAMERAENPFIRAADVARLAAIRSAKDSFR